MLPLGTDLHSGTSLDWYSGAIEARFSYAFELRDVNNRFKLPPKFIVASGEETWAAFKVMLDKVIEVS